MKSPVQEYTELLAQVMGHGLELLGEFGRNRSPSFSDDCDGLALLTRALWEANCCQVKALAGQCCIFPLAYYAS